jgi:hypothetical protein
MDEIQQPPAFQQMRVNDLLSILTVSPNQLHNAVPVSAHQRNLF